MSALYWAYGSNLDRAQMRARCRGAVAEVSAVLRGYRLAFGGFSDRWDGGVATLERDPNGRVDGVLYRVTVADLLALDRFEGRPHVYERMRVSLGDALGRRRRAQTYVMPPPTYETEPSLAYLGTILRAYIRLGFDRRPLLAAAMRRAA
jgi:cation transport regulator ChaC